MKTLHLTAAALCAIGFAVSTTHAADSKKKPAAAPKAAEPKEDAAKKSPVAIPDTVAIVDGTSIKRAEVEQALNSALAAEGHSLAEVPDERKVDLYRKMVDGLIVQKLVQKRSEKTEVSNKEFDEKFAKFKSQFPSEEKMNEALKQGGETLAHLKEELRSYLREQKWIESQIAGKDAVSDADAKAFYDKNPDQFSNPEQVRASHILILVPKDSKPEVVAEKEKLAKSIAARAKKGEPFDKLAEEFSEDPGSKKQGGDLDFFGHGQMVPEFETTAFAQKKDEISAPVKSKFGFHIIKTTDHRDAGTVPFAEVKGEILEYLKKKNHEAAQASVLTELRSKADVKVNLPPESAPAPLPARVK